MLSREQFDTLADDEVRQLHSWCMGRISSEWAARNQLTRTDYSEIARRMSAMAIGDSELFPEITKIHQFSSRRKYIASRLAGSDAARWVGHMTTKGCRVTRVA